MSLRDWFVQFFLLRTCTSTRVFSPSSMSVQPTTDVPIGGLSTFHDDTCVIKYNILQYPRTATNEYILESRHETYPLQKRLLVATSIIATCFKVNLSHQTSPFTAFTETITITHYQYSNTHTHHYHPSR